MTARSLSDDTLATVLLCGNLGASGESGTPLSRAEWNALVRSLIRANWRPGDVMRQGAAAAREALDLDDAMEDRLQALLSRAVLVAAEIERLAAAGIGILSRADDAYPSRWRTRLREQSPPLLYVSGPAAVLERGGVAAVGSRNVDEAGAEFARRIGSAAARAGTPTISGGARGVDREAMFGALEAGGEAIGIMPDGLARALRSPDVRRWVGEGQLTLASAVRPNAGFSVGNAMGRNKLIYALADISVVISSDAGKGGTWAGATENLARGWSPLFVRDAPDAPEGNRELIRHGGIPLGNEALEAGANGDLLTRLLDRAAREPAVDETRPAQQSFLIAEAARAWDSGGRDEATHPVPRHERADRSPEPRGSLLPDEF